jgi:hypothetical protein
MRLHQYAIIDRADPNAGTTYPSPEEYIFALATPN